MMASEEVFFREIDACQIACIKTVIVNRSEVLPFLDALRTTCGKAVCGSALCVFHSGAVKDGLLVEVAVPVDRQVENGRVYTRTLENAKAWCSIHHGSHENVRQTVRKIVAFTETRAGTISSWREHYTKLDLENPANNMTEVQVIRHEWDQLLAQGVEQVMGAAARRQVMEGIEQISPETPLEQYTGWICHAMQCIDSLTDDPEQKYLIVSRCAHVFPEERIVHLRSIYESSGDIDDVLREMYKDPAWYEDPVRRGNVLFMRKVPFNPDALAKASSTIEKRRAYCHCKFVRPYLKETPARLSPTFCWCGAGWYKRLWEGVLGKPVKVEHVETLLNGNDQCTLRIILPLALNGEFTPESAASQHA